MLALVAALAAAAAADGIGWTWPGVALAALAAAGLIAAAGAWVGHLVPSDLPRDRYGYPVLEAGADDRASGQRDASSWPR